MIADCGNALVHCQAKVFLSGMDLRRGRVVDLKSHRGRREILSIFFVVFLIVCLWMGNAPAAEIHLAWDKNSEPQVTGYKIYYGFSSRQYDHVEDAGDVTQYVLKELATGRYYIAAKAYDGFGNMSDYSEELIVDLTEESNGLQVPVASDVSIATIEDVPVNGRFNCQIPNGAAVTFVIASPPAKGTVTVTDAQKGEFTYVPFAGSTGRDSFTFQVSEGDLLSDTATVTVDLLPRVDIPLEAEDGNVQAPLEVNLHPSASGGASVQIPSGAVESVPLGETAGKAEYIFEAPASGRYYIWAKVLTPSTQEKALFVSVDDMAPVPWEPAMGGPENWIWDSLSERTGGIPKEIYLEAGSHQLTLYSGKSDIEVDQILITNDSEPFSGMTILEDAEDGKSDKWQPLDGTGAQGDLTNQFDGERGSRIIHLNAEPLAQFYSLPVKGGLDAKNADPQLLQWSMKSEQGLLVGFTVETSSGDYQVIYWPRENGFFRHYYKLIYIGLGESLSDGTWHSFIRNIQQDVSSVDPGINILRFKSFLVTGRGNVDDIKLR